MPYNKQSLVCFASTVLLFAAGGMPLSAQVASEVIEAEPVPRPSGGLTASPREDLFRIANLVYDQAQAEKTDMQERRRLLELAYNRYVNYRKQFPAEGYAQQAMYREALILIELNKRAEAQKTFEELTRTYKTGPFVAASAYRLATLDYETKNYQRALSYYSMTAKESDKPELKLSARYMVANCYLMLNRKNDAVATFNSVISDPQVTPALKNSALLAVAALDVEANRLESALVTYTNIAGAKDVDAVSLGTALLQGAALALKLNKPQVAEKFYNQILTSASLRDYHGQAQVGIMEVLYHQKKYDAVLREMSRNASAIEKSLDTRRSLLAGQSALNLKKYTDAISHFSKVEQLAPLTEMALESAYRRLLCSQELKLPNWEQSVKSFMDTYSRKFPDSPYIHLVRVMQADGLSANDPQKAGQLFKQVDVTKLPVEMRADVLYKQAWVLSTVNDRQGALRALDDFIMQYPADKRLAEALVLRGAVYARQGDEVSAMSDFNRVIKTHPKEEIAAVAWQRAAQLYSEKQDTANMIKYYEGLIKNFPKAKPAAIAEANYMIGKGYFDQKKYEKAVGYLEEARTVRPDRYRDPANNYLVYSFYELKDTEKLRSVYDRLRNENYDAAKALPEAVPAWLGAQCFAFKDYNGADSYLTMAADIAEPQRTKSVIWSTLAKARLRTGKYDRALKAVDFYLDAEKAPNRRAQGLLDKAVILARMKKLDEAQATAEEALTIGMEGPIKATLNIILGDIAYARKNYEEAGRLYGTTAALFTSDRELKPQALYKAAVSLEKAGKNEAAAQYAKDLKTEYPNWKPTEDIFDPIS